MNFEFDYEEIIHLSIVRRTPRPPGMVRHLSNVSRIFIYHDSPVCLDYDGPFLTMTVPGRKNMTHQF